MRYSEIPKKERNGIKARIDKAIEKYGFDKVRLTANKVISDIISKQKLQAEISEKEKELAQLRKNK